MPYETRQRLKQVLNLLRQHSASGGLTTTEIAEILGVTRQTAHKDIERLSYEGYPIAEDGRRYFLDPDYKSSLHLSLTQAWFLYFPLRRFIRSGLYYIPAVSELLLEVTNLFRQEIADQIMPPEPPSSKLSDIIETLMKCWERQQLVQVHYRRLNSQRTTRLVVQPWWFEPAVWSDGFYLLGGLVRADDVSPITLKLERIQKVEPLKERFERPPAEDVLDLIKTTWGIWSGEDVLVRLRFHYRQLDRLKETRWHPSQRLYEDEQGYIIWEAEVAEPQEMLPWIRGWGADVEVLDPDYIRQQVAAEAEALARLYGRADNNRPSYF